MRRIPPTLLIVFALVATACTRTTVTESTITTTANGTASSSTTTAGTDPGFYLNLMWHQHQPFYPKDEDGVYTRPWVRVHATKDYYDMAAMLEDYPNVTATFNLTPVLLLQLEDLAAGARDIYWVKAEVPADELTDEDKQFILERFFDANPKIIARFPRYQELADSRAGQGVDGALASWTDGDIRDLQVLFNLAWTDPGFLAEEPLASLVAKGEDFAESDKITLFDEQRRIISEVIPLHARLWEEGKIEVTTTPLAHPILPLISDTALASVGDPAAILPDNRYREIQDANVQVVRGLDVAEDALGRRPTGMWPGEGSVAQLVMGLFSQNGVRWVATGEDVLARSLDVGSFTRTSTDVVEQAGLLYRPWDAQLTRNPNVAMFFRDVRLSDQIGFEYSGTGGAAAADDFMQRLRDIRDSLDVEAAAAAGHPYVVSVILDGENAWENYENDGKDFLDALYRRLNDSDWVRTITPSEYLDRYTVAEALDEVWPGAWFQPNFATWIGEPEEATAWDYLYEARQDLKAAEQSGTVSADAYEAAFEKMLFAEGSDWFWWYGSDQDSGNDSYFDTAYRELLGQVYDALGQPRPDFLAVPIIPQQPVTAGRVPADLVSAVVDGAADEGTGAYDFGSDAALAALEWGYDRQNLYVRMVFPGPVPTDGLVVAYLGAPQGDKAAVTYDGTPLGFGATHTLVWDGEVVDLCPMNDSFLPDVCASLRFARAASALEAAVPLEALGALETGDTILAKVEVGGTLFPSNGPAALQVPDISNVQVFLDIEDPTGDDHGPGTYTYPTDGVFAAGSYDIERFQAGTEGEDLVLTFDVLAAIQNPWGSPRGFSVQTFDVYIDTDPGTGTGARLLIPGRNAALEEGSGWEYGITVEGWDPAIYVASADGTWEETKPSFDIVAFGDKGKVVIRIPMSLLGGGDPATWGFAAAVMSQEGYPSSGVRRIRDVEATAQQWRIGGGPGDINHTRILDAAWTTAGDQEALLSNYPAVTSGSVDDLGPDDFPVVPVATAG